MSNKCESCLASKPADEKSNWGLRSLSWRCEYCETENYFDAPEPTNVKGNIVGGSIIGGSVNVKGSFIGGSIITGGIDTNGDFVGRNRKG